MTVKVNAFPPTAVAGTVMAYCVAAAAATETLSPCLSDELAVSVTVSVSVPALNKVAVNVPVPSISRLLPGSDALVSLLLKCTVPV